MTSKYDDDREFLLAFQHAAQGWGWPASRTREFVGLLHDVGGFGPSASDFEVGRLRDGILDFLDHHNISDQQTVQFESFLLSPGRDEAATQQRKAITAELLAAHSLPAETPAAQPAQQQAPAAPSASEQLA